MDKYTYNKILTEKQLSPITRCPPPTPRRKNPTPTIAKPPKIIYTKPELTHMPKQFQTTGFKNFQNPTILDFSNIRDYKFNTNCLKNNLLNTIIIYGKNAVGKSNFGLALFDIVTHLTTKNINSELYDYYLNTNNSTNQAEFRYLFQFGTDELDYRYKKEENHMANKTGPQPDIKYCPICKGELQNVPRDKMKSKGYIRKDGTVSEYTHTYDCSECNNRFEINQDR